MSELMIQRREKVSHPFLTRYLSVSRKEIGILNRFRRPEMQSYDIRTPPSLRILYASDIHIDSRIERNGKKSDNRSD